MWSKVLSISVSLLFGLEIISFIHGVTKEYHFINMNLTWAEAQQFCREHYTDLATVESTDDLNGMNIPAGVVAWIGLHDDRAAWYKVMTAETNSWRWSSTGTTSPGGYQNWHWSEPSKAKGKESCGIIQEQTWKDYFCSPFKKSCLCFTVQSGVKQFFLVNDTKRDWYECQSLCRQRYQDLAVIESEAEDQAAMQAMAEEYDAFIGLYRNIWSWSDLSNSNFRNWKLKEPNNEHYNQHCVSTDANRQWEDNVCTNLFPFICHRVGGRTRTKIWFQTSADLSDPAVREQLLKQIQERFSENGDFRVRWTEPPTKQEEKKKRLSCDN